MSTFRFLLTTVVVVGCSGSGSQPPNAPVAPRAAEATPPGLRLPAGVRPTRYAIDLSIDPARDTFSGVAEIELAIDRPMRTIWLHGEGLDVIDATLRRDGSAIAVTPVAPDLLKLTFANELSPGTATIQLGYTAKLGNGGEGAVFKGTHKDETYVGTFFEPTSARRAFPCFDEPQFKVPWRLTLRVPRGVDAYANTAPTVTEDDTERRVFRFAETPPLPSYLVAFAVGKFDILEAGETTINRSSIRVLSPAGTSTTGQLAAQVLPESAAWLERYFGVPYPYDKLDNVAIPGFIGGMEHPGLISYGPEYLLTPPDGATPWFRQQMVRIITHEIAHQWFGNLVTPMWWDDLWLNEAFATWIEIKATEQQHPEWQIRASTMRPPEDPRAEDSLPSARAVRQPIAVTHDIMNAFDDITYLKGAAVLGMIEGFMGEQAFRHAVQRYLTAHVHGTATSADFAAALATVGGPEVIQALESFTTQPGVPMVSVALSCQNGTSPRLKVSQRAYRAAGLGAGTEDARRWAIPMCVRYGTGKGEPERMCQLVTEPMSEMILEGGCPEWVQPNAGAVGYYHTRLEGELFDRLVQRASSLPEVERASLVADLRAGLVSGELGADRVLALLPSLVRNGGRPTVLAGVEMMRMLARAVPADLEPAFADYVRATFGSRARTVGWTPKAKESDDVRLLRPELLQLVAGIGRDSALAKEAQTVAERWIGKPSSVPDRLGLAAVKAISRTADRKLFDRLVTAARAERDPNTRNDLLLAVRSIQLPEAIAATVELAADPTMQANDVWRLLSDFYDDWDPTAAAGFYAALRPRLDTIAPRVPKFMQRDLLRSALGYCDANMRAQVADDTKARADQLGGARAIDHVLEGIDRCAGVRVAQQGPLRASLTARAQKPAKPGKAPKRAKAKAAKV
ncbi:MAG: M1 family metallopeptidase [Kofleriaceae bacterium]